MKALPYRSSPATGKRPPARSTRSQVYAVRDRLEQLRELDKRREAILKSLEETGKLTDELKAKVLAAETLTVLEDIYLPYRPKRRTRATIAREKGLEPLALRLFSQEASASTPLPRLSASWTRKRASRPRTTPLSGARDIIAEWVNEDQTRRGRRCVSCIPQRACSRPRC